MGIAAIAPRIEQKTKPSRKIKPATKTREETRIRKTATRTRIRIRTKTRTGTGTRTRRRGRRRRRKTNAAVNPSRHHRLKAKVAADLGRPAVADHAESGHLYNFFFLFHFF